MQRSQDTVRVMSISAASPTSRRVGLPRTVRVLVIGGALLAGANFLSLVLAQPWAMVTLIPLAFVPLVVVALIRWSDPYRVSQEHLFPWALMMGGGLVAASALTLNTVVQVLAGELTVVVLGAPLIEELLKGAAVMLILRSGAIGPVTLHAGAAVGALVGAGFAFTEDLSYALASQDPLLQTMFRLLFGPFFHATTGALFGVAFAWGTSASALAAMATSIALHVLWNTLAQVAVSLPAALTLSGVLTMMFASAWSISGWQQRHRVVQAGTGWMLPLERELLSRPSLVTELASRRPNDVSVDDIVLWKRALLHVTEVDEGDVQTRQNRLETLDDVRGSLSARLSSRCTGECIERFPMLAHHHFMELRDHNKEAGMDFEVHPEPGESPTV